MGKLTLGDFVDWITTQDGTIPDLGNYFTGNYLIE